MPSANPQRRMSVLAAIPWVHLGLSGIAALEALLSQRAVPAFLTTVILWTTPLVFLGFFAWITTLVRTRFDASFTLLLVGVLGYLIDLTLITLVVLMLVNG